VAADRIADTLARFAVSGARGEPRT
jgi:hypothetical protein